MQYEMFANLCKPFITVSHETFIRLQAYIQLLQQWQSKINLISPNTLPMIWERHIFDSIQLIPHLPKNATGLDFGSGAGFPGAILALVTNRPFSLIESDQRKSAFLLEASRVTATPFKVVTQRVEALSPALKADVVTARAFAPLAKLLPMAAPWLSHGSKGLFLKGKDADKEIKDAEKTWQFNCQNYPSVSDPTASILVVSNLTAR